MPASASAWPKYVYQKWTPCLVQIKCLLERLTIPDRGTNRQKKQSDRQTNKQTTGHKIKCVTVQCTDGQNSLHQQPWIRRTAIWLRAWCTTKQNYSDMSSSERANTAIITVSWGWGGERTDANMVWQRPHIYKTLYSVLTNHSMIKYLNHIFVDGYQ